MGLYMDPSYNNSFGSFGSGGGVPGGGVVGNGVGTGGDIILSSSGEKKSKKWFLKNYKKLIITCMIL